MPSNGMQLLPDAPRQAYQKLSHGAVCGGEGVYAAGDQAQGDGEAADNFKGHQPQASDGGPGPGRPVHLCSPDASCRPDASCNPQAYPCKEEEADG